ncbi:tetratricopeptide repeat-containing diguanylate cyclase [Vibrio sp. CAU 1672]|uniref:tetratricopeptide repeat-containing diguanylate cyclase n=1 Tax=Vibrio sp. CAU 1672 TaxID=3032594 RepID=UPI0023DB2D55|nr:tetratricopeptide repeat-containing diguanylate cyclase [Vibrio sp. CAU 1672]MDF2153384.1 diguanylate cyclase [Vibrio sp. CAU 1672]
MLLVGLSIVPLSSAAPDINHDSHYLARHTPAAEQATLQLYFDSISRPRAIPASSLDFPSELSPHAQALYYFARIYLSRYEGLAQPATPDLVVFGQEHNLPWVIAEAKFNQALELIEADELWRGELLLHDVISLARDIGYQSLQGRVFRWLGNAEVARSQLKTGLRYYLSAYKLLKGFPFEIQEAMTLNNIATVYMDTSDWPKALTYIDKAFQTYLDEANQFDNSLFLAIMNANKSVIKAALGYHEESEHYFNQALKLSMETGSARIKHTSLSNFSQLMSSAGKLDEAYTLAERCLSLPNPSHNNAIKNACYEALAHAYLADKDYAKAIESANRVLDKIGSTVVNGTSQRISMLSVLVDAYQAQKNYESAFHLLAQLRQLEQEFTSHIHGDEMLTTKFDLETKLAQQELKLLTAENALQAAELSSQRYREGAYFLAFTVIVIWGLRRIRQIKAVNQTLKQQNFIDPLTELHNRRYLQRWIAQMAKGSPYRTFSLAVIDIDHFKNINDQHGHDIGDKMLKHVSSVLENCTRSSDLLVRWGGEEFVLLFETPHAEKCVQCLERLRLAVENESLVVDDKTLKATISLGAVDKHTAESYATQWDTLFLQADQALYQAKKAGRNRFMINH